MINEKNFQEKENFLINSYEKLSFIDFVTSSIIKKNNFNFFSNNENNESLKVRTLKKLCKLRKISGYTKLSKNSLIKTINKHNAAIKIQNFFRKKLIKDNVCPISMNKINYPCWAFKPQNSNFFIYYNLPDIINYLLSSGDFRDPKTREQYTKKNIQELESLRKKFKIKGSLEAAKKNSEKRKNNEDTLLAIERYLDEIVYLTRVSIEEHSELIDPIYLITFKFYIKKTFKLSPENANIILDQTLNLISDSTKKSGNYLLGNEIINYLYHIKFDELK